LFLGGGNIADIKMEIPIPTDNQGFVLLKCEYCGEFFKLIPSEMKEDNVIEIWCPCCGLRNDNYLTEDVVELVLKMSKNIAMDMIFNGLKNMKKGFNNSSISFKAGKRPDKEIESPIVVGINALAIKKYFCCRKSAKIKPLIKMCGSYCPYCGVRVDEFK
jgi:hypothetical protein